MNIKLPRMASLSPNSPFGESELGNAISQMMAQIVSRINRCFAGVIRKEKLATAICGAFRNVFARGVVTKKHFLREVCLQRTARYRREERSHALAHRQSVWN